MPEIKVEEFFIWEPFLFKGTPFEVNRVVVLMWVVAVVCIAFFLIGARRRALVPKGGQTLAENAYLFVRHKIAIDVIGQKEGPKYADYLAALFFFIFFANLFEIVPGINFPVTSRMALPALLAILTWIIFNVVAIKKQGWSYYKEQLFPPGVPWPIYFLLTPIEFFSVFIIRPFTLAVRLFANMVAGHVLLTIFFLFTHTLFVEQLSPASPLGVLTFAFAAVVIVFELLVITLQAYIFTMLSAFYISESEHGAH